jgi:hypothetical protein
MRVRQYLFSVSLFFLCGLFSQIIYAQEDSLFHFSKKIEGSISSFTVGNLGELYLINTNNQLKKYDENGDSVGVFNLIGKYGKLSYVEAQNPWKTALFYGDFSTIVLLDKYLNVTTSINLRKANIFKVKAITTSFDNNIWLFDEQNNQLKKIDDAGNILFESVDFRHLFDQSIAPSRIIDRDGFVYLYDALKGLYVFDYYGSFKNKFSFFHWKNFSVIGKDIYGFDSLNMYKYESPLPNLKVIELPKAIQNSQWIQMNNFKLYALKNGHLWIYSIQ